MTTKKSAPQGAADKPTESELSRIKQIEQYVQNFSEFGLISKEQSDLLRQNLRIAMDKMYAKAEIQPESNVAASSETENGGANPSAVPSNGLIDAQNPYVAIDTLNFEQLAEQHSKFLEERKSLKEYLVNAGVELSKEEFEKIFALVHELENQAVARFKQVLEGRETLKQQNELARQKLQTASATGVNGALEAVKRFTPEQIGKMTSAEFIKFEPFINEQIRKGEFGKR